MQISPVDSNLSFIQYENSDVDAAISPEEQQNRKRRTEHVEGNVVKKIKKLKQGLFKFEEDFKLLDALNKHGKDKMTCWKSIRVDVFKGTRSRFVCIDRYRYYSHLSPRLLSWTQEEKEKLQICATPKCNWAAVAKQLDKGNPDECKLMYINEILHIFDQNQP